MSRQSSRVAHSGASISYSRNARSPLDESKRQIFSATFIGGPLLVLPLLRLPFRHPHRFPLQLWRAVHEADDRVLEVVLVVAHRIVVGPRVGAAALLALDARDDHALGEVEEEAELDRLREVAVEDLALVLDQHVLVALAETGHDLALLLHLALAP